MLQTNQTYGLMCKPDELYDFGDLELCKGTTKAQFVINWVVYLSINLSRTSHIIHD